MEAIDILREKRREEDRGLTLSGNHGQAPYPPVWGYAVQDQGYSTTRFSSRAPQRPLHWQRHGTDPTGQSRDIVFAGGGEEEHWSQQLLFDAIGRPFPPNITTTPEKASRAYDSKRDGFGHRCGGGMVVVEELRARRGARCAKDLCRSWSAMAPVRCAIPWLPRVVEAPCAHCSRRATVDGTIDYLNTHGTSTPVGDVAELQAIREVVRRTKGAPKISSTQEGLSGSSLGAAGVTGRRFYCLLIDAR